MEDSHNISGLIHHLSRQLTHSANQKWAAIGHPLIRTTHVSILVRLQAGKRQHHEIARTLGISRQAVSRLNRELIEWGYVRTEEVPGNRKAEALSLTPKGEQFMGDFKVADRQLEAALDQILGAESLTAFKAALVKLNTFFSEERPGL